MYMSGVPANIVLNPSQLFSNEINNAPVTTGSTSTSQLQLIASNMVNHDIVLNNNLSTLQNVASAQNTTYTIAANETQRLADKKNNIDQALQGQNRMIALNDSYVKKYAKYNQIVMVIVLIILAILGAILIQSYLPMVPSFIGDLIMILAVAVGGIVIYLLYMNIQARDSLYFDKLNIPSPTIKDLSDNAASSRDLSGNLFGLGYCVGQDCCSEPSKFINSLGKCVNPPIEIYDYATQKYKVCSGISCPTTYNRISDITWGWDVTNNQWVNPGLNGGSYWDFTSGLPGNPASLASLTANQVAAPKEGDTVQGFTTMMQTGAQPLQSSEMSDYSFYR